MHSHMAVGRWEPHTASMDFCEENYLYTTHVAELFNSASALAIIVFSAWGLTLTPLPFARWPRFVLSYLSLIVVGVGSVLFHATLKRTTQGLDEVPMVFANLVSVYCIANSQERHDRSLFSALAVLGAVLLVIYLKYEWYAVFLSIFAIQSILLIAYSYRLCFRADPGENAKVLRRLWRTDVGVYAVAFFFWVTDNVACAHLGVGYLHILWHLLGAFSSCMFPLILVALTADGNGYLLTMRWRYGVLPFLTIRPDSALLLQSHGEEIPNDSTTSTGTTHWAHALECQCLLSPICDTLRGLLLQAIVTAMCLVSGLGHFLWRRRDLVEEDFGSGGPSVSFSGCAFWWPYVAGVCQYLFEEFELADVRVFCTSASSFPVVCALMGVNPLHWCTEDYPKCLEHWYSRPLNCFLDRTSFLRKVWQSFLPSDAHRRVEGRLVMSLTRFQIGFGLGFKNEQVASFPSNEDLIDTLMATINVPGLFFRGLTRWRGFLSFHGAYSEPLRKPGGNTVVINLSRGEASDILPSTPLPWLWQLLPQPIEKTKRMMRLGYEDARANHAMFEKRGWRAKAAGPADSAPVSCDER